MPKDLFNNFMPVFTDVLVDSGSLFSDYHIVTNFVAAFAIVTDFGSNLENLYEMGFPVPKFLLSRLKIAQERMDSK